MNIELGNTNREPEVLEEGDQNFTLYWRTGKRDVFAGRNISDAFRRAGYGGGAIRALDFYADGDDDKYAWNTVTKEWDLKIPLVIG